MHSVTILLLATVVGQMVKWSNGQIVKYVASQKYIVVPPLRNGNFQG